LYGPDYPAWRHPVMVSADAAIAWIALRRPQWLILALTTWVIEQTMVNGFGVLCALVTVAIVAEVVATRVTKRWPQRTQGTQREKTLRSLCSMRSPKCQVVGASRRVQVRDRLILLNSRP